MSAPEKGGEGQLAFETLNVRQDGAVLFVEISAPPINLLGPALVRDLVSLVQLTEANDAYQVLVFKSADPDYFISHVDVTRIKENRDAAAKLNGDASLGQLLRHLSLSRLVTIAQIEGRVRGVGSEFVLACDMRFAAQESAIFGQFEPSFGVIPGAGGAQHLTRLMGRARALEVMLSAEDYDADLAAEYTGFRVRTPDTVTYVMDKTGATIVILIFAPDPSVKPVADRLAANVGNGNGLNDDPAAQASLSALPAQLPDGIELAETNTYSGASLEGSMEQVRNAVGQDFGTEANQWIDKAKSVLPPQLTTARYVDQSHRDFNVAVGNYGSSWKAWAFWQLLRATVSLTGMRSVSMNGGEALTSVDQGREYMLFRRGGCLGVVAGPDDQTGRTLRLAEAIPR